MDIVKEVCRGLEFAHSRGIIHRDLKPGNVWLTEDGTAKIGDFGLAVVLDRSRITGEGMMVGTVSYMPAEQAMGGEVTPPVRPLLPGGHALRDGYRQAALPGRRRRSHHRSAHQHSTSFSSLAQRRLSSAPGSSDDSSPGQEPVGAARVCH